ncbi:lipopolysaccharide core heptose(II) kinase RfaY [Marinobacter sp.]|uniref:lipopolysaccharide core heptose(II) kinase RfaY n=1 Tax=Marinobacter sp. TaxID=50741 RepID=UPI00384F0AA6
MTRCFEHRDYQVYSDEDQSLARQLVDAVLDERIERVRVFRDNRRTLSARVAFEGRSLMLKVPRARNLRRWERFLTRFRHGEGVRIFQNLRLLKSLGLNAPAPVLAAEKRENGVVTGSFVLYHFAEGAPAGEEDAGRVLEALLRLHSLGYIRTDPQPANFLMSEKGVVFIDFRLKRPGLLGRFRRNLELAKFLRGFPAAERHLQASDTGLSLKLARLVDRLLFGMRNAKRKLRRVIRSKPAK